MKRVADDLIDRLYSKHGVRHISLITGNGSLVINDAICQHGKIRPVFFNHEASAGYCAVGYSKYSNRLSVVNPIGGCGSTNCMTALLAAFQDHVPVLFLSGNVALKHTTRNLRETTGVRVKKLGVQELDIIEVVEPLTKYRAVIQSAWTAHAHLDNAIAAALTPPFGPVWLDVPADVGSAPADGPKDAEFAPMAKPAPELSMVDHADLVVALSDATRPLVLAGNGVGLSGSRAAFKQFVERLQLPCVFTYGATDLLASDHPLHIGRIGIKGTRAGNMAVQNCDLLLILGACLNVPQTGYERSLFAPNARKIAVDVAPVIGPVDQTIVCDLKEFFHAMA